MVAQFLLAVPFMLWQKISDHVSMRSAAVVVFSAYIGVCLWCLACSDIIYIQLALMSIKSILLALALGYFSYGREWFGVDAFTLNIIFLQLFHRYLF